jgi:hypothetical protein
MLPSGGDRMVERGRGLPMLVFGVLVALVASLLVTPVASADPVGLELRSAQQLSPRLTQLRVYTPHSRTKPMCAS